VAITENLRQSAERRSELNELLRACGFEPPTESALDSVLSKCPDVDLAFTALTMDPRPGWVAAITGRLEF
jgi:hypothetical protein